MTIGACLRYPLNPLISVLAELAYVNKGWIARRMPVLEYNEKVDATYQLDYIEIPLLIRLDSPEVVHVEPYVFVGPYFGWLVRERVLVEAPGVAVEDEPYGYGLRYSRNFDFGLTLGGEVILRVGRYGISIISIETQSTDGLIIAHEYRKEVVGCLREGDFGNCTVSWLLRVEF